MAARQEESGLNLGPFVVLAIGAGTLWWLLPKVFPRSIAPTPSTGPYSASDASRPTAASSPLLSALSSGFSRLLNRDLIALLSSSQTARKAYLFQAGMYSFYQTNERPDGKNGPVTRSLMDKEAQALGTTNTFSAVNDTVLLNLGNALRVLTGVDDLSQAPVRLAPGALPQGLINQINSEGLRIAADIPLLQIEAG